MMEGLGETQQGTHVGGQLRSCRLRARLDLADVAVGVHIRRAFLEAIESGRYELLPGFVYAQGFVRAYAEYLGLDGDVVAKRFRAEIAGRRGDSPLRFPLPQVEGETPKGGMLLLGALIAVVAYGSWYVLTSRGVDMAELIAPLPERLERLVGGDGSSPPAVAPAIRPAATGGTAPTGTAPTGTAPTGTASVPAVPLPPPPMQNLGAASPAPAAREVAATDPAPTVVGAPRPATAAQVASVGAALPQVIPIPGAGGHEAGTVPPTGAPGSPTSTAEAAVEPAVVASLTTAAGGGQALAAEPPDGGVAPGATSAGRIVLRAKADSWVEVRDAESRATLVARLLRPGEVYRVPDRPGLTLVTGNAGGIVVLVDGETMPPLGRDGVVRRGILLDPQSLRRGVETAASQ